MRRARRQAGVRYSRRLSLLPKNASFSVLCSRQCPMELPRGCCIPMTIITKGFKRSVLGTLSRKLTDWLQATWGSQCIQQGFIAAGRCARCCWEVQRRALGFSGVSLTASKRCDAYQALGNWSMIPVTKQATQIKSRCGVTQKPRVRSV